MEWKDCCSILSIHVFQTSRDHYLANPDPTEYLGLASKRMYEFVRQHLRVPFQAEAFDPKTTISRSSSGATIGSLLSTIHAAIRNGALYVPVMECLRLVHDEGPLP